MLNNIGPMGFLLIAVVVLVLFGRGKISGMMGEVGKGITAFRRGIDDGRRELDEATAMPPTTVPPTVVSSTVVPPTVATSAAVHDATIVETRDRA